MRTLAKVHLHRATLGEIVTINGARVLPVGRTVVDLAREHGVIAGLAAADFALHERRVTEAELAVVLQEQRRWPGIKKARWVADFADARTESPLESASRFRCSQFGLPAPRPQARICDLSGTIVARCDFYWDEFGVAGEADGAMKWENDPAQRDKRDEKTHVLESLGLIVVDWGWPDLRRFGRVAHRLQLGFARGAGPGSPQRRWFVLPD